MTLNLSMPGQDELKPRISVFGVGGAGGNAVNNMIEQELQGVEFVVANTDAQALQQSRADQKVQMGVKATEGLGAGARATVGAAAAEESIEQIVDHLAGAHMCFITAGMGGGTGTGAAPIIAQAARELGVLTVGVVTKPFQFEGGKRMRQAEEGVEALQKVVDTLIIIPNQNLFRLANENTTFTEAFALADDVLYQGVKGVTDLMVRPGLINLDFADVRAVMDEMGKAMMGTGEAEGAERAVQAAEKAIANPLLDEISLEGAKGVLINITGGYDLTLFELDEAANKIREKVDPDANIIVGSTLDTGMEGQMRVSVVATGIDAAEKTSDVPLPRRSMAAPLTQHVEAEAPKPQAQPEPEHQPAAEAAPEPTLFDDPGMAHDETAHEQAEDIFDAPAAAAAADDDLPQPAYQPRAQAPDPQIDADPEGFVAPQRPAAGTPSPETLDRLRAAASRAKGGEAPAQPDPRAETPEEARPRLGGLNGLINRMTGHGEEQRDRAQPQVTSMPRQQAQAAEPNEPPADSDIDPDEERIEIPAFLRRQAN
ncbi:cell division protein FtsZ [Salibaculum sp.]|uniref:cell division protein FtsZ n=1 Tax=Salibaculum sp. TaxID=2855480 RepID=UPI002B46913E|nr:cell division protein FtsZ [Salibaculum sp.]HKL69232.1 cell division protein FtsZ [Salibaculum sp.]